MRYRDECMPLVSSVDTVYMLTTFAWRSLTTGGRTISPLFFVSKIDSLFLVHHPPLRYNKSQTKIMYVDVIEEHRCVCSYSYVPILLHESTNHVDLSELV